MIYLLIWTVVFPFERAIDRQEVRRGIGGKEWDEGGGGGGGMKG